MKAVVVGFDVGERPDVRQREVHVDEAGEADSDGAERPADDVQPYSPTRSPTTIFRRSPGCG